jgi:hypothetical protein
MLHDQSIEIYDVQFVPADYDGSTMQEGDLALDIYAGGKGIKGDKSAFSSVLRIVDKKYAPAFKDVATFIDVYDSTGDWKFAYGIPNSERIPTMLDTFRWMKRTIEHDGVILYNWCDIIKGVWLSYNDFNKAKKLANKARWVGRKVALIEGRAPMQTYSILFNIGAEFVIYEDGNNLGVIRSNKSKINLGESLVKWFPDWFHHPDGFLSCWGSAKAPKDKPSGVSIDFVSEIVSTLT